MKKSVQLAWLLMAILLFVFPFPLFNLVKNNIDTENHENRELAQKPELDLLNLAAFPQEYDDWMNDHLPFRNQLIAANSLLSIYLFQESPSDSVIVGKDGWYFYNSIHRDDGDSLADYQGTNLYTQEELEQIKSNMLTTQQKLAEEGIEFILVMAPNKERVYADKMPAAYGPLAEQSRVQQVYDYLKDEIRVIYLEDELMQARERYPQYEFYCHLDTHWTNLGAYVGARTVAKEFGHEMPTIDQLLILETPQSGMDLSAIMNLTQYLNQDVNYNVGGYNPQPVDLVEDSATISRYKTSQADDRKVLLIRDSFGAALAPFVASQFNDMVVFPYADYEPSMLDAEKPDIVMYEVVERYVDRLRTYQVVP